MLNVLNDTYFTEHYSSGFVDTNISLPTELVDDIKKHYLSKAVGHNDFPKFFVKNEHQAYLEGPILGFLLNTFPTFGKNMVKKFYDKAYQKAVYCDQTYIERVLNFLLANNFQHLFKTRYMIAGYDMYLRNDHRSPAAGIHTDLPNFHHFYETENDMSLYIPLVDLDETNGGRITVLPEDKLKVPGNILLKLLREHFATKTDCLDENGYIDPEKISAESMSAFIKSAAHQNLMTLYKNLISIAKKQYANAFQTVQETKGKVLLFNNKNFHAAESWKNQSYDREVYVIRMFPIYDANIKLKRTLHDKLINNFLVDTVTGQVHRFDHQVDLNQIPADNKLKL
jgi:hypothetical protein